jgi:hypothetical protein
MDLRLVAIADLQTDLPQDRLARRPRLGLGRRVNLEQPVVAFYDLHSRTNVVRFQSDVRQPVDLDSRGNLDIQ